MERRRMTMGWVAGAAGCLAIATWGMDAGAAPAVGAATAPAVGIAAEGAELHQKWMAMFIEGKWEELEKALPAAGKEAGLSAGQKADVVYMRKSLAEGRQAWRKQSKAGKTFNFKAVIWGRSLATTFDPGMKGNVQMNFGMGPATATVMWATEDMDSDAHAEHGFTKGELSDLGVWSTMGMADGWTCVPTQTLAGLNEEGKIQLQRYLEFRSNVTGIFYAMPRARLWGLWLHSASFMEKYKGPTVNSRRAIGAMLVAEVVGRPEKYPTLKLPTSKEDWTEEGLALHFKDAIEKKRKEWSFEEDKTFREAFFKFATANDAGAFKSGKVTLGNGQAVSLDPAGDKALQEKRNAWLGQQFKVATERAGKKPS